MSLIAGIAAQNKTVTKDEFGNGVTFSSVVASSSLPMKKRKNEPGAIGSSKSVPEQTSPVTENQGVRINASQNAWTSSISAVISAEVSEQLKKTSSAAVSKGRELRLAQNRKAARESRRRKKGMLEELQSSRTFFFTANRALKQQNEDLTRLLQDAHAELAKLGKKVPPLDLGVAKPLKTGGGNQGGAANASSAGHLLPGLSPLVEGTIMQTALSFQPQGLPVMQPGATMQAMANFQQAATAAMQPAAQGMHALGEFQQAAVIPSQNMGSFDSKEKPSSDVAYI